MIYYTTLQHKFGKSLLAWSDQGLSFHLFDSETPELSFLKKFPDATKLASSKHPSFVTEATSFLKNYFQTGNWKNTHSWIDWSAFTPFQQKVYRSLMSTKKGSSLSYQDLARKSNSPGATRAVGTCMSKNPLPIFIPCHRVLKADGSLGNFSSARGPQCKRELLDLEKKRPS